MNSEKKYVTYWCLDFCILYNGAYDYFKFARAKYCAYAALAKRDAAVRDRPSLDNDNVELKATLNIHSHTETHTLTHTFADSLKRG